MSTEVAGKGFPTSWAKSLPAFAELLGPVQNFVVKYRCSSDRDILLPNLSNGYIGTDPTTCWIFLDGIFTGEGIESCRAAIPSPVCWVPLADCVECLQTFVVFHFGMGVLLHIQQYQDFDIYTSTFASKARPHLLFRSIEIVFKNSNAPNLVHLKPSQIIDWSSPNLSTKIEEINDLLYFSGQVCYTEDSELLPRKDSVYLITDILPSLNEDGIMVTRSQPSVTFLTTLSRISRDDALQAYEQALDFELTSGGGGLLNENAHAWLSRWSEGRMLIGDGVSTNPEKYSFEPWQVLTKQEHHNSTESLQTYTLSSSSIEDESFSLARCLISAQFALLSNFPESPPDYLKIPSDSTVTKCAFFGLSPSGLGRGNTADDYMGHVFWDMDIWMLPWVSLFHPSLAQLALDYRNATLPNAELRAKREGKAGARFAWESARTGLETSPWSLSANSEVHVVANVSIAVQNWLTLNVTPTGLQWYETKGRRLLDAIATFWSSRVEFSKEKNAYVILGVMPPDEYCSKCDNSAYTNAAAALALAGPAVMSRLFNQEVTDDQNTWEAISHKIWMPFDEEEGVMLEYENYKTGTIVKQADAVLLNYPLMYQQSKSAKIKMIKKYAAVTSPDGPAMTWAMFFISALEVGLLDFATEYLEMSLRHCSPPFYIWTEQSNGEGAVNFITGVGGFLQSIINGLFGLRVCILPSKTTPDGVIPALLLNPKLIDSPSRCDNSDSRQNINVFGVGFCDRRLNFSLNPITKKLTITLVSGDALCLRADNSHWGKLTDSVELPIKSTIYCLTAA